MIHGIELDSIGDKIICDVCIKLKITCKPLPKDSGEQAKKLGEKVYSNVWGPSRHLMTDTKSYYVSFIDNYLRESVIYLMSSKDQVFSKYKLYEAMMLWAAGCMRQNSLLKSRGRVYKQGIQYYLSRKGTKH